MIEAVFDSEVPETLIRLKRRFREVEAELAAFSKTLPSGADVAGGKAEITPDQRAEVARMRVELTELTSAIQNHDYVTGVQNRNAADEAANKAAKAES